VETTTQHPRKHSEHISNCVATPQTWLKHFSNNIATSWQPHSNALATTYQYDKKYLDDFSNHIATSWQLPRSHTGTC